MLQGRGDRFGLHRAVVPEIVRHILVKFSL